MLASMVAHSYHVVVTNVVAAAILALVSLFFAAIFAALFAAIFAAAGLRVPTQALAALTQPGSGNRLPGGGTSLLRSRLCDSSAMRTGGRPQRQRVRGRALYCFISSGLATRAQSLSSRNA